MNSVAKPTLERKQKLKSRDESVYPRTQVERYRYECCTVT